MSVTAPIVQSILFIVSGILSSVLFTFIVGYLDTADYLVELWTLWIIEVPYIVFWSFLTRKRGWRDSLLFGIVGTIVAYVMFLPDQSITVLINLKAVLTGIILGRSDWFNSSFSSRLAAVTAPGFVFALVFGLPFVFHGVSPETIDRFKTDALEMYKAFMTNDEALNASNNAVEIFKAVFKNGFAVLTIGSLLFSWLSFQFAKVVLPKLGEEPEQVLLIQSFKLPFHTVWIFIVSFGLILSEFEPLFPLALNVVVIMAVLYFLQGFAVVIFHMNRLSMGRLPRILFWLFFFFTIMFSGIFLVGIGLMENWFKMRITESEQNSNDNGEVF